LTSRSNYCIIYSKNNDVIIYTKLDAYKYAYKYNKRRNKSINDLEKIAYAFMS